MYLTVFDDPNIWSFNTSGFDVGYLKHHIREDKIELSAYYADPRSNKLKLSPIDRVGINASQ